MGSRMRRTTGGGWIAAPVFMGVGCEQGGGGWVPACARTTGGDSCPPFLPGSEQGGRGPHGEDNGSLYSRGLGDMDIFSD